LFFPEIGGMVWHIRHGTNVEFSGLRFHVPALYSEKTDRAHSVLYMTSVPGRARTYFHTKKTFSVSLITVHQLSLGETGPSLDEVRDPGASKEYVRNRDINVKVAGSSGRCVGYNGPPIWSGEKDLQIWCQFAGGFQVVFTGTEPGSTDFFSILKSAKAVEGNR
jgi:hypothetical protein